MGITYRFEPVHDNMNPEEKKVKGYYPRVVSNGTIDKEMMFDAISHGSSSLRAELSRAWMLMEDFIVNKLQDGYTVNLDGFGSFSVSAQSRLVEKKNEIRAESIRVKGMTFRASEVVNKKLKRTTFEREAQK
ncbi:MAG: hypothetical protein LUH63_12565 [Parabacteroides sp.]|nr:hypothetical protein [Parabacteroides sp.]